MERETILKAAVAACFKAEPREAVNVANVRKHIEPDYPDFFDDFDTGKPLDDVTIFREIQAVYKGRGSTTPNRAMLSETPDGRPLAVEPYPAHLPPSEHISEPVNAAQSVEPHQAPQSIEELAVEPIAEPVAIESTPGHAVERLGQSPQERLNAARSRESNLLSERPQLINAQRQARGDLETAKQALAAVDPNRMTPAELSADYRRSSQANRAERVARQGSGQSRIAFVDLQRKYSTGGTADDYARKLARTANRRGAYDKSALGMTNTDPSRGPIPKPITPPRPTIPALAK